MQVSSIPLLSKENEVADSLDHDEVISKVYINDD